MNVRHGTRQVAHAGIFAAILALAVAMAIVTVPGPHMSKAAATTPSHQQRYRICSVADCSGYPVPATVRGVALSSLENWLLFLRSADAQIRAVTGYQPYERKQRHHKSWNGNAIRLQILQDKLVGPAGYGWSPSYFYAIRHIARYALLRHLTVIINAQTEPATGFPQNELAPTAATYAFWRHFARVYGHNRHVVFDLFNEPRCYDHKGICNWQEWRASMWPLVRYVRAQGSENQLWLEGKRWGSQLGGVPLIPCHQDVAWCQGLVYSFHKPGCPWPGGCPADRATWWSQFGYLTASGVPVVNGEMTNYRGGYYWDHSTATMTRYLGDLRAWGIGVVAWSLQPGIMTATSSLTSAVSEPQGAGRIFWRDFHGNLK